MAMRQGVKKSETSWCAAWVDGERQYCCVVHARGAEASGRRGLKKRSKLLERQRYTKIPPVGTCSAKRHVNRRRLLLRCSKLDFRSGRHSFNDHSHIMWDNSVAKLKLASKIPLPLGYYQARVASVLS